MEIFTYGLVGYLIVFLGMWTLSLIVVVCGNMIRSFVYRRSYRGTDTFHLVLLFGGLSGILAIIFIHPYIIQTLPAGVLAFSIGVVSPLLYLTEKHWKDWVALCNIIKHPKRDLTLD